MREPYIGHPLTRVNVTSRAQMVPAQPVIEHIERLRNIGMTVAMIARAAGVTDPTIRIAHTRKTMRSVYAELILSVDGRPNKHQALVLATGSRRRLQGLAVTGWSTSAVADSLGVSASRTLLIRRTDKVTWAVHCSVRDVYARFGADGGDDRVRAHALAKGWVHPLLWDDIDDPFETVPAGASCAAVDAPDPVAVERLVKGAPVKASRADRVAAFRLLLESGASRSAAAQQLGINHQTAVKYAEEVAA